jgi:hypothetical protein
VSTSGCAAQMELSVEEVARKEGARIVGERHILAAMEPFLQNSPGVTVTAPTSIPQAVANWFIAFGGSVQRPPSRLHPLHDFFPSRAGSIWPGAPRLNKK